MRVLWYHDTDTLNTYDIVAVSTLDDLPEPMSGLWYGPFSGFDECRRHALDMHTSTVKRLHGVTRGLRRMKRRDALHLTDDITLTSEEMHQAARKASFKYSRDSEHWHNQWRVEMEIIKQGYRR